MDQIATLVLQSGRSAVELALFILLPIMIIMLSLMRWLEARGWLQRIVTLLTPVLRPFGLTGMGVFAMIQVLMVSFAAPIATLAMMARGGASDRHIAATFAMVLALAQANVVFPMAAVGLNIPATMLIALGGGLLAAAACYYGFGRQLNNEEQLGESLTDDQNRGGDLLAVIRKAGQDAWDIAMGALPLLVVALVAVKLFTLSGAIQWLEQLTTPVLAGLGYPGETLLLGITKYVAGGTAMMGLAVEAFNAGQLSSQEINLLAGLLLFPLDVAGVAILIAAGKRVAAVVRPAIYGALIGISFRILMHWLMFS
ncbi:nucleoside recognition domain-containing protein [Bacterioplanoides pacificum]|uniref:Nucleoside recognition domain-containing protein n=1 Tax=Bacterioplanoides pacificum TaxID=1171596 RepID=A0ABV7VUB3_9GAMM